MQRAVFVAALVLLLLQLVTLATQGQAAEHRHARPATSRVPWYTRVESPEGWVRLDAAKPDEQLTFTVIVTGSGAAELERLFWSRSDPDSADFGEWMSNAAIEQLVSPSVAELQQLYGALAEHGIGAEQVVSHGDSFDVTASVQQAESLLDTRLFRFQHSATGLSAIRQWGSYSLPAAIAEQAELVLGVHTFPPIEQRLRMTARRRATVSEQQQARESSKAKADAAPSPAWVPQALAAFYGVPYPIAPLAYSEVSGAVIEWEEQTFSQDDLAQFANDTATPVAPVDPSHIIGNDTVAYPGIEASLDIQWMEGINAGFERKTAAPAFLLWLLGHCAPSFLLLLTRLLSSPVLCPRPLCSLVLDHQQRHSLVRLMLHTESATAQQTELVVLTLRFNNALSLTICIRLLVCVCTAGCTRSLYSSSPRPIIRLSFLCLTACPNWITALPSSSVRTATATACHTSSTSRSSTNSS